MAQKNGLLKRLMSDPNFLRIESQASHSAEAKHHDEVHLAKAQTFDHHNSSVAHGKFHALLRKCMAVECNFDIRSLLLANCRDFDRNDSCHSSTGSRLTDSLKRWTLAQQYYSYPDISTFKYSNASSEDLKKIMNLQNAWWMPISDNCNLLNSVRKYKLTWQKALLSALRRFLSGTLTSFYILHDIQTQRKDVLSDYESIQANSTDPISAYFYQHAVELTTDDHAVKSSTVKSEQQFACMVVGASKWFLDRLSTLGCDAWVVIDESDISMKKIKAAGRIGTAGLYEHSVHGRTIYIAGEFAIRIVVDVIAEFVFEGSPSSRPTAHVPFIVSQSPFNYGVLQDLEISKIQCSHRFDCPSKETKDEIVKEMIPRQVHSVKSQGATLEVAPVNYKSHRLHFSGIIFPSMLHVLTEVLQALSCAAQADLTGSELGPYRLPDSVSATHCERKTPAGSGSSSSSRGSGFSYQHETVAATSGRQELTRRNSYASGIPVGKGRLSGVMSFVTSKVKNVLVDIPSTGSGSTAAAASSAYFGMGGDGSAGIVVADQARVTVSSESVIPTTEWLSRQRAQPQQLYFHISFPQSFADESRVQNFAYLPIAAIALQKIHAEDVVKQLPCDEPLKSTVSKATMSAISRKRRIAVEDKENVRNAVNSSAISSSDADEWTKSAVAAKLQPVNDIRLQAQPTISEVRWKQGLQVPIAEGTLGGDLRSVLLIYDPTLRNGLLHCASEDFAAEKKRKLHDLVENPWM